ncbi:MAG TPA: efflux RND transporter permease subunit, partial [Planctomycetota bacterium]|nr:efflux RND transporter permease subunit [Planctomycetota bacterium]
THAGLPEVRLGNTMQLDEVAAVAALPPNYGRWVDVDGKPGCILSIYPTPDANSYGASGAVTRVLEREAKRLGLKAIQQGSTHQHIDAATGELVEAAIWGGVFSVVFLLLFLGRMRLALLVCASLPLSLALAVLAMACHENSMNLFTLMGFLLACGMVVDNAIVVGEALLRARGSQDPAERTASLRRSVAGVAMAIVVSTLTTVALFLPIAVVDNPWVRVLIMSMGEPIIWSLLGSLVVALVLVPMAFPRLYRGGTTTHDGRSRGHARWLMASERAYGRFLAWILLRPVMGVLLVGVLVVPGVFAWMYVKEAPKIEEEDDRHIGLSVRIRGNPSSTQLREAFAEWDRQLATHLKDLAITSVISDWRLDRGTLNLYLNPIDPLRRHENDIQAAVVTLLKPNLYIALDEHMQRASSEAVKLPDPKKDSGKDGKEGKDDGKRGGRRGDRPPRGDRPRGGDWASNSRLNFRLMAPDEDSITQAWEKLRPVLAETPGVTNPGPQTEPPPTETELMVTRAAEERGWRADQLAGQVTRFGGTRQLLTMPDGWALAVGPLESQVRTLQRLLGVEVRQSSGDIERLENLVTRNEAATQNEIRRRDGLSQRDYWMMVEPGAYNDIRSHLSDLLARADVPPATQIGLSWWEEHLAKQQQQMLVAVFLSGVIIYLLMGVLYESVLAPLSLMLTVPIVYLSVQGAFKAMGMQIDNMVQVGSFLLIGVVVNHGVVLIDRIGASVPMTRLART